MRTKKGRERRRAKGQRGKGAEGQRGEGAKGQREEGKKGRREEGKEGRRERREIQRRLSGAVLALYRNPAPLEHGSAAAAIVAGLSRVRCRARRETGQEAESQGDRRVGAQQPSRDAFLPCVDIPRLGAHACNRPNPWLGSRRARHRTLKSPATIAATATTVLQRLNLACRKSGNRILSAPINRSAQV